MSTTSEPDPAAAGEGPDADPESVARRILLDQLSRQARSRQELSDRLAARRVPPEVAARVLDRFTDVGLVDDTAFARSWVGSRQARRGLARPALAHELRRKGVDDEVARSVLAEIAPEEEEAAARAVVRRRLRSLAGVEPATARRRLLGALARKGHSGEVARRVVGEELGEAAGPDSGAP